MQSNLPPGARESDMPEAKAEGRLYEEIEKILADDPCAVASDEVIQELVKFVFAKQLEAYNAGYCDGTEAALRDV